MPELQPLSCSNCAAPLTDDDPTDDVITCEYCGQVHKIASAPKIEPEQSSPSGFKFQPGDTVAVKWGRNWWDATVMEPVGPNSWKIHYDGWSSKWDEVVDHMRIVPRQAPEARGAIGEREALAGQRSPPAPSYDVGAEVAVKWKGQWYDATILAVESPGRYRIHYDGWSSSWDETVGTSRIAERGAVTSSGAGCGWLGRVFAYVMVTVFAFLVGVGILVAVCGQSQTVDATGPPVTAETVLDPGDKIHVQWGSSWYLGTVIAVNPDGRVQIHYEGFDESNAEVVARDRLRLLPGSAPPSQ